MPKGFPTPAMVADTRSVSWDVGPGVPCWTEPKVTVEHSPTTYVLRQLSSCTFPLPRPGSSASSVPSSICGLKLSSLGQVGKQMSISFFLLWLCLLLHLPQERVP